MKISFYGIEYPNQLLLDSQVPPWANFLRRFITSQFLRDFKLCTTFKRNEKYLAVLKIILPDCRLQVIDPFTHERPNTKENSLNTIFLLKTDEKLLVENRKANLSSHTRA